MTLTEKLDRRYEDGRTAGEVRINSLYQKLRLSGRMDDLFKAMDDPAYRAKLLEEFGL